MRIEFLDSRAIDLFVDSEKNIVIFPKSKSDGTGIDMFKDGYYPAYYPIELIYPYTAEELAEKIKLGFEEWDKHECYNNFSGKNTLEEKYYGIKGFKNAVKGKSLFNLEWGCKHIGNNITFGLPAKRGYAYFYLQKVNLPADAEYLDYANAVIKLINTDLTTLSTFKTYKSRLNL